LSDAEIEFIDLAGITDDDVAGGAVSAEWSDIIEMMSHHEVVRSKKSASCFSPVRLKPESEWVLSRSRGDGHRPTFRNDQNVDAITLAVLDLDLPQALEKAEEVFSEYDYVVYSTFSYCAATPYKYRLVVRLQEPVSADDWPHWHKVMVAGIDADKTCGNLSRIYFYPSVTANPDIPPKIKVHSGRPFEPGDLSALEQKFKHLLESRSDSGYEAPTDSPWWSDAASGRHFSAGQADANHKPKPIDNSYQGFLARHRSIVDENLLGPGESRHHFALRCIGREFVMNKKDTNLALLLQFIYRASEQFSSKPLYAGDTPQELPEMIESALVKFEIADIDDALQRDMRRVLANTKQRALRGDWSFPSATLVKRPDLLTARRSEAYQAFRASHSGALRRFSADGDVVALMRAVIQENVATQQDIKSFSLASKMVFLTASLRLANSDSEDFALQIQKEEDRLADQLKDMLSPELPEAALKRFAFAAKLSGRCAQGKVAWDLGDSEHSFATAPTQDLKHE